MITAEQARKELRIRKAKREQARRSVFHFLKYTFQKYTKENWHHKLISRYYQDAVERKRRRVMVMVPSRHMKTENMERAYAWAYGRDSDERIMHCAATVRRARKTSINVKRNVKDRRFTDVWPNFLKEGVGRTRTIRNKEVKEDQMAFWELGNETRGSFLASGVGGNITGDGYTIGSIDDPYPGSQEARSPTYAETIESWYFETFLDRQDEDNSSIILTMHRWGVKDLMAVILERDGIRSYNDHKPSEGCPEWNGREDGAWDVLCLPRMMDAEAYPWKHPDDHREEGDLLWPERFGMKHAEELMRSPQIWAAKQQQRPKPEGGNIINRKHFTTVKPNQVPTGGKFARLWDLAATDKLDGKRNNPDFTAGGLVQYVEGKLYIWHVAACQQSPLKRHKTILRNAKQDRHDFGDLVLNTWEEEGGASGKDVTVTYKHLLKDYLRQPTRVGKSKEFYVRILSNKAETGDVYIVDYRHWIHEKHDNLTFMDEAELFPSPIYHDDRIDAVAKACWVVSGGSIEDLESPDRDHKPVQPKSTMDQVEEAIIKGLIPPKVENLKGILEAIADKYVNEGDADKADLFLDEVDKL